MAQFKAAWDANISAKWVVRRQKSTLSLREQLLLYPCSRRKRSRASVSRRVPRAGFEPAASALGERRSFRLSYRGNDPIIAPPGWNKGWNKSALQRPLTPLSRFPQSRWQAVFRFHANPGLDKPALLSRVSQVRLLPGALSWRQRLGSAAPETWTEDELRSK